MKNNNSLLIFHALEPVNMQEQFGRTELTSNVLTTCSIYKTAKTLFFKQKRLSFAKNVLYKPEINRKRIFMTK